MRVLALVPSERGYSPGQRSSIELWEKALVPAGIHVDYAPFESPELRAVLARPGHTVRKAREMLRCALRRARTVARLDDYDAVFVYREAALLGPALFERWIARRKPLVYGLDDPLYVPYVSPVNGYLSYLKCFGKVKTICRISTVVIVNSSHHRSFAAPLARDVREIPSLVDETRFHFVPRPPRAVPCIGWSGSPSTVSNVALVAGPLREVQGRHGCDLHFIGSESFPLPGLRYTAQEWRAETEAADLRRLDVGLVPLPDNPWNRRKFYMKVAQYMALGIVPVATPLGANADVIEHGRTGFLAQGPEEWVAYLEKLITDPELRAEMGRRAAQAATRFTLAAQAPAVVDAFRSALG